MSDHWNGRRFRIPVSRRLTWDLLHFHKQIPLCAHDRNMHLMPISQARQQCPIRISWPAVFLKAFSLVARDIRELRRTWQPWPWAHLYQHPHSVASLTVHRRKDGQPWLFWGQVSIPEATPLADIQKQIDRFRDGEVDEVFRKQIEFAVLPTFMRRMIWWWNLNIATQKRAKRLGTFFLSTLAGRGAEIQLPPSIHTACLTYGPLNDQLKSRVTLAYDHRIMDGALVAEVLQKLEQTLNETLVAELQSIKTPTAHQEAA